MDREAAMALLPPVYAEALRLHEADLDHLIAERLEVPIESVGPLLRLAEAKLAGLLREKSGQGDER